MKSRRRLDTIAGRVNADGTIAAGDGFTVQKGTAGVYTITLAPGFRLISAVAGPAIQAIWYATTFGYTERSFSVLTMSATTGTDQPFTFHADGVQT